jgi:hypothetical protein
MPKDELVAALIEVAHPDDVGGQQIWRPLYSLKGSSQRPRQRLRHHGLAHARYILNQDMTITQQRDQQQINDLRLADNHTRHIVAYRRGQLLDSV